MTDWNREFNNRASVADFEEILADWQNAAKTYREAAVSAEQCELDLRYGDKARNRYDLFLPDCEPKGTVIFIHGGYWRSLDKSYFSHLAAGPASNGWAVAMPSYTLAPEAKISEITKEIAQAISRIAQERQGSLRLIGHSAGGHLVARMLCNDCPISEDVYQRIENTVAVSGVFELRNLLQTAMNDDLRLDENEVERESPANLKPRINARITCVVGGAELPEFLRQNEMLAHWQGFGAQVSMIEVPGKHHFNVIEGLASVDSLLTSTLLA